MQILTLRNQLERIKGKMEAAKEELILYNLNLIQAQREHTKNLQAREIIKEVGLQTQKQLEFHISDIVSSALSAVFADPYSLKVEFVERRNKTECDLLFVRDGNESKPTEAAGGGAVDVASFALRVVSWVMRSPHTRATIVLDEPLRFLSKDLQEQGSKMIKELSEKLGLQFIIITHEDALALYADNIVQVKIKKGKSFIL